MSFDISVSQPHLRRDLELDLQNIIKGRKTIEDVLYATVEKYRHVFGIVTTESGKFSEAMTAHFGPPNGELFTGPSEAIRKCSKCSLGYCFKKTKAARWIVTCPTPTCNSRIFLDGVANATVKPQVCGKCRSQEVCIEFSGRPPLQLTRGGTEYSGCIFCNTEAIFLFQIPDFVHRSRGMGTLTRDTTPRGPHGTSFQSAPIEHGNSALVNPPRIDPVHVARHPAMAPGTSCVTMPETRNIGIVHFMFISGVRSVLSIA